MRKTRPAVFDRHFEEHVIVLCVSYLRYCLTLRDLEELMAERGLGVAHSTIGRWALPFGQNMDLLQTGRTGLAGDSVNRKRPTLFTRAALPG